MTASHIVAGAIDTRRGNTIFDWLIPIIDWLIPIILIIRALKRTGELTESA